METIIRRFAGASDPELSRFHGKIPRVGDHLLLEPGVTYCVTQILWDSTVGGVGEIFLYLDPVLQCGSAVGQPA